MDRRGPRDETRGIETMVLMLFAVFTIFACIATSALNISKFISVLTVIIWVVSFVLYIIRYHSFRARAVISSVLMQVGIIMYAIQLDKLDKVIPLFMISIVVTQLYGIPENMFVMYASALIIFGYHASILHTIAFDTVENSIHYLFLIFGVFLMISIIQLLLTKRKISTSSITHIITELKKAEEIKDQFLSNVSHEIRTPINTICGMSEMALVENDKKNLREEIYSIQSAGRNLMSVVSDILDFSELQNGKVTLEEEEYNITSTINDIINTVMARKENKSIEFIVDCNSNIPSLLYGDEKKIRRVVMNIINNAIKFTNDGCIAINVSFRRESYGVNLIFNVKDTGIGMSDEDVEKLFVGFTQADETTSRQNEGLGLGLAISNAIVRKMGGVITVRSKQGKGTSIRVTIPQKVIDNTPIISVNHPENINVAIYFNMEKFRLIQIRDEYSRLIKHIIGDLAVKSHVCRNIQEIKRRTKSEEFSHIFIGYSEYLEDRNFFDNLSKRTIITVLCEQDEINDIDSKKLNSIIKPFYVLPICSVLNGINTDTNSDIRIHTQKFIAPDAKIMVVDDNEMNIRVIEGLLGKYKIQVVKALSGAEALEKITSMDYDFIFMDHMMPEMDGIETAKRIREKNGNYYKQVPIIALTANAIAGAREYFIEEGFSDFVEKPVELSVLERVLKRNIPEIKQILVEDDKQNEKQDENKNINHNINQNINYEETLATSSDNDLVIDLSNEGELSNSNEIKLGDLFNTSNGISFCGSEEMYYDVLKSCYDDCEDNLSKMNGLYKEENWKDYIILVHALKSTMKTIGAAELSEKAKGLEFAGKENNIDYIKSNHESVMQEYEELMKKLENVKELDIEPKTKQAEDTEELTEIEEQAILEYLTKFEDAVFGFDESTMMGIVEELGAYKYYGIPLKSKLSVVREKVEKSDYMSAHQYLGEMIEGIKKKGAM